MFVGYRQLLQRWRMMGLGMNPSQSYINKVLNTQRDNLIGYWPMNELSGTNADNAEGTAARDGTYSNVALDSILGSDGRNRAGLWNGATSFLNVYSADLNTAFGAPARGTVGLNMRVLNNAVYTDGLEHRLFTIRIDAGNRIIVSLSSVNNQIDFSYRGSAAFKAVAAGGITSLDWMRLTITWDSIGNEMKAYINKAQVGATQTPVGALVGNLAANNVAIGAQNVTPLLVHSGYLDHAAVWTSVLTQQQIGNLSPV